MAATVNSPSPLLVIHANITTAASAAYDYILTRGLQIVEVTVVKGTAAGGVGDTVQLQTVGGAANITNAIDCNVAADTVVRTTLVVDPQNTLAAGAVLRHDVTTATNTAMDVFTYAIPSVP